jgi:hypothetical protein
MQCSASRASVKILDIGIEFEGYGAHVRLASPIAMARAAVRNKRTTCMDFDSLTVLGKDFSMGSKSCE